MPRVFLLALLNIVSISLVAQVYHFETGKVISGKPGQIVWKSGVFEGYPADFGTYFTFENPQNPKSKEILIPIVRVKAIDSDSVCEPVFLLHGGPGEKNIQNTLLFKSILQHHNLVLIGYRGIEGSLNLNYSIYKNALFCDSISFSNYQQLFTQAFNQTLQQLVIDNVQIQGFGINSVVHDIEQVRNAAQYDSISFLSFSYGTMVAQMYAMQYPQHVKSNIQIGARPIGDFIIDNQIFKSQLQAITLYRDSMLNAGQNSFPIVLEALSAILSGNSTGFNPIRFSVFFFSQMYTLSNAIETLNALMDFHHKKPTKLITLYRDFYQFYPNLVLTDLLLKKQNYYDFSYIKQPLDAIDSLMLVVNYWYSPKNNFFETQKSNISPDFHNTYFIFGDLDVATPNIFFDTSTNSKNHLRKTVIKNAGHLDLFFSKKKELEFILR